MLDLLIAGGEVASSASVSRLDVGVQDGRIAFLATPGIFDGAAARIIDATGKVVVPGGVDAHVHFSTPWGLTMLSQSATSGGRAAAFGGTTTFIDFAAQHDAGSLLDAISARRDELKGSKPSVDYALHAMITGQSTLDVLDEMPDAIKEGITSFKVYTTFSSASDGTTGLYSDDGRIWGVMSQAARLGGIVMVHCEDDSLIAHNIHCLYRDGQQQTRNMSKARTGLAEEAAIRRMLLLSRRSNAPLYVCHISSRFGMEALAEARDAHIPAFGEVLHNNLSYTSVEYERPDGMLYHCYPGLKPEDDQKALWEGVTDGIVDAVSSDEFTLSRAEKLEGQTVDTATGGHNGIETRIGVFYSGAVTQRSLSLRRFVELTSEGPARLFGLYPRKGVIAPGSDADIVLLDPKAAMTIRQSDLHSACDYSIWDGWECAGYPSTTILRGNVLVENGQWVGSEGLGDFLRCTSPNEP